MNIEGDFFACCGPVFVAETVCVPAVGLSVEGVIARADGALVDLIVACRVLDLMAGATSVSRYNTSLRLAGPPCARAPMPCPPY